MSKVCCTNPLSHTQPPTFQPTRPTQPVRPETPEPIPPDVFTEPQPVTPYRTTTPVTTTITTTTPRPTIAPTESSRLQDGCYDPNNVPGVCTSIKECPSILNEFLARQKDQAYIKYIQSSNANCNYIQPNVSFH